MTNEDPSSFAFLLEHWYIVLLLLVVVGAVVTFFVMRKKPGSSSDGEHHVVSTPIVSPAVPSTTGPMQIDYVTEFSKLYNTDLAYIGLDGTPVLNYHVMRFERPDVNKREGTSRPLWGGMKAKSITWIDNPSIDDLTYKMRMSDITELVHVSSGTLVAKTDNYSYAFRKDAEGFVTVVESVNFSTNPPTEKVFRLAKFLPRST
jgi:hypothetical protein